MTSPVSDPVPVSVPWTGPGPGSAPGPDPELIAPLVQACPAVAGLHGGAFGEVATYLPGRRVRGIRVREDGGRLEVEIHVVGRYPVTMDEIAGQVRAAAAPLTGPLPVHVVIDDLALPGDADPGDAIEHDPPRHHRPEPVPGADSTAPRPDAPAFPPPATPQPAGPAGPGPVAAARPPATRLDPKERSQ